MYLNQWAVDNFQWASNLIIVLSFTTKLYNFILIVALGLIKYIDLKDFQINIFN